MEPVTIGVTPPDRMEIALVRGSGRIQGRLADPQNAPVPNAQIVLIPNSLRARADLYRTATTDGTGRFDLAGILAGEYKAFAWANIAPFRYFDPDFLRPFEDRGEPVVVENGVSNTITIRRIP